MADREEKPKAETPRNIEKSVAKEPTIANNTDANEVLNASEIDNDRTTDDSEPSTTAEPDAWQTYHENFGDQQEQDQNVNTEWENDGHANENNAGDWNNDDDGWQNNPGILDNSAEGMEELSICPACLQETSNNSRITLNCGHHWCRDCINDNYRSSLRSRTTFPPKCCGVTRIEDDTLEAYLDDDVLLVLTEKTEEYSLPDPTYCCDPKCGVFVPEQNVWERWATCPRCKTKTCVECKGDFDQHPLPFIHPDLLSTQDRALANQEGWQQCPNLSCRKLIEKVDGCNHMICCDCKTEFCYACGRELQNAMPCACNGQPEWVNDLDNWANNGDEGQNDVGVDPEDEHEWIGDPDQEGWNGQADPIDESVWTGGAGFTEHNDANQGW